MTTLSTVPMSPSSEQGRRTAPVVIGDDVWVGAKSTITSGVTIGDGAVVGAHAVVTTMCRRGALPSACPPGWSVCGTPSPSGRGTGRLIQWGGPVARSESSSGSGLR